MNTPNILIFLFLHSRRYSFVPHPTIRVSIRKNLTDAPYDLRKLHTRSIPTLGGVMIFAGTLFAFTLFLPTIYAYLIKGDGAIPQAVTNSNYLVSSLAKGDSEASQLINGLQLPYTAMGWCFIGVKDDIIGTAAIFKLLGHIIIGMILVIMGNIRITGFHGLFGVYGIPYWASVFLLFTYVVIVNSINFIDGIDGLAAGIGFIGSVAFGIWFALAHSHAICCTCICFKRFAVGLP